MQANSFASLGLVGIEAYSWERTRGWCFSRVRKAKGATEPNGRIVAVMKLAGQIYIFRGGRLN